MKRLPVITSLAIALAVAIGVTSVHAASAQKPAAKPDAAAQAELDAARADLHRAAERVATLQREMGAEQDMVIERRMRRGPVLGVVLQPADEQGVLIEAVTPESAAAAAGLRRGDRVVAIDGKPLAGNDGESRLADARGRLRTLAVGKPVTLGYVRDGRSAQLQVTPREGEHMLMVHDGESLVSLHGRPLLEVGPDGAVTMSSKMIRVAPGGVAPEIHREIVRIDRGAPCADGDCRMQMLEEAFRWNGLNLASVDARLGRYFGTNRGVLVLSMPEDMGGLQPGDVILRLDGKDVNTPREAMAAAHARKPGTAVQVEYLRDRKQATTSIKLPERRALRFPEPPTPPAAPGAPRPAVAPRAAAAPPAPATPMSAPRAMTAPAAMVPPPPAAPATAPAPPAAPLPPPPPEEEL